jgi:hypothetical protein
MAFDLRGALLKKEERESARLADFEFKLRARTFRLLGKRLGLDAHEIPRLVAQGSDAEVLAGLARRFPGQSASLEALYQRCRAEARAQLIDEQGDPSPHRLA